MPISGSARRNKGVLCWDTWVSDKNLDGPSGTFAILDDFTKGRVYVTVSACDHDRDDVGQKCPSLMFRESGTRKGNGGIGCRLGDALVLLTNLRGCDLHFVIPTGAYPDFLLRS